MASAHRRSIGTASLVFAFGCAVLITAHLNAQGGIAIVNATVIDGNGTAPIPNGVVLVQGERIVAVGSASAVKVPSGVQLIDASGKTVMPALADMHVHLVGGWDGEAPDLLGYQRYLNALLYSGVTTVLDLGNVVPFVQQVRDEIAAGRVVGPRVRAAGPLIDGTDAAWRPLSYTVASTTQLVGIVKELKSANFDIAKAYVGLSHLQIAVLVREAAAQQLRVFVDAGGRNGTAEIAALGIAAFAHLGTTPLTGVAIETMRKRGVATISTLAVLESFSRRRLQDMNFLRHPLLADTMPPHFQEELKAHATKQLNDAEKSRAEDASRRLRVAMSNAKQLVDAGLIVAAGTDAAYPGVFFGEGIHRELELLVEAGLTPIQAITAATKNAAILMNEADRWGTIAVGRRADIIIVAGFPAMQVGDSRKIDSVIYGGRVLDRSKLRFDSQRDGGFKTAGSTRGGF